MILLPTKNNCPQKPHCKYFLKQAYYRLDSSFMIHMEIRITNNLCFCQDYLHSQAFSITHCCWSQIMPLKHGKPHSNRSFTSCENTQSLLKEKVIWRMKKISKFSLGHTWRGVCNKTRPPSVWVGRPWKSNINSCPVQDWRGHSWDNWPSSHWRSGRRTSLWPTQIKDMGLEKKQIFVTLWTLQTLYTLFLSNLVREK